MDCPICFENITSETGVVKTSCNHSYHFACLAGWLSTKENGSCPSCRKEMTGTEQFPEVSNADDESDDYEEPEEVEFTRAELEAFLRARGGEMTEAQVAIICPIVCGLTFPELNFIMIGICGRTLTDVEWDELMDDQEEDESDDEESVDSDSEEMVETLDASVILSNLQINMCLTDDGWSRDVRMVEARQVESYEI